MTLQPIAKSNSFDELYQALQFTYIANPTGTITELKDNTYDLIYSSNVLEHVHRNIVPELLKDFERVLKPGGYSIYNIDIGDHLVYLSRGRTLSRKHYLNYTDTTWRRFYDSPVQYFNRIQRSEWFDFFGQTGLELKEEQSQICDISSITVSDTYKSFDQKDLETSRVLVIHQKSLSS